jgi:hypothetical protein
MRVGILSDTHGTLSPAVVAALTGVDRIIHAGDIGGRPILDALEAIAPVTAVRGNMDTGDLEWRLPDTAVVRLAGCRALVVHRKDALPDGRPPEGVGIVVSGHTHRALVERAGGVLFINPGSAGGRNRDGRGPTVAILDLTSETPTAELVEL